jgi:translation initiation factor 1
MAKARPSNARLVYSTGGPPPAEVAARVEQAPRSADKHGIRLHLDRRASGRLVTVVTGLPGTVAAVRALASELRAACGAGGTVRDGALELQGDHREKVESVLRARGLKWKRSGG